MFNRADWSRGLGRWSLMRGVLSSIPRWGYIPEADKKAVCPSKKRKSEKPLLNHNKDFKPYLIPLLAGARGLLVCRRRTRRAPARRGNRRAPASPSLTTTTCCRRTRRAQVRSRNQKCPFLNHTKDFKPYLIPLPLLAGGGGLLVRHRRTRSAPARSGNRRAPASPSLTMTTCHRRTRRAQARSALFVVNHT